MLKLLKWLFGLVCIVAVFFVLAIVLIPRLVDPNDHRETISKLVMDKTGRELELNGDLSISVFPWLGIETQGLSLSQPKTIGGKMVSVADAQLRVKLVPLLSKRLEVDTIVLNQPDIKFITLKDGTNSADGLSQGSEADQSSPAEDAAGPALALVVQGISVKGGNLLWDDRQAKQQYKVSDLNIETGNLLGNSLANLVMSGVLTDAAQPEKLTFDLQGKAKIDVDSTHALLKDLTAKVNRGDLKADLTVGQLDYAPVSPLTVTAVNVDTSMADMTLNAGVADLTYQIDSGEVSVSALNGSGDFMQRPFQVSVPKLAANLDKQTANASNIDLKSDDLVAKVSKLVINSMIDNPQASGHLQLDPFNARNLLKKLEIDFEPELTSSLTSVGLVSDFKGTLDSVSLKNLSVKVDKSQLKGSLSVKDFANPDAVFDLTLDKLNIDEYLPEVDESESSQSAPSSAEALAVPMALFKDIRANGSFVANQLIASGVELNNIDVGVKSVPGKVTVTPKAKLYDGSLAGKIEYTEQSDGQAQVRVINKLDLVSLAGLLTAADVTDQLSGIGSLDVDFLVTEKDGVQSNKGTIKLSAKDGAIKGIDVKGILDQAQMRYNQVRGKDIETGESSSSDETKFAELLGTFHITDYKIDNNDFSMKAPLFRVAGKGDIDVLQQTLDYLVSVSVVNTTKGQGGESLDKLKGLTLPVRFKGSLLSPSYSLDLKELYKSIAAQKVDEKKDEYLKEKLGVEEGSKLSTKDLLKQALINKANKKSADEKTEEVAPIESASAPAEESVKPVSEEEQKKAAKDDLKDQLKGKLLEGLFK